MAAAMNFHHAIVYVHKTQIGFSLRLLHIPARRSLPHVDSQVSLSHVKIFVLALCITVYSTATL